MIKEKPAKLNENEEDIKEGKVRLQKVHSLHFPGYPSFIPREVFREQKIPWPVVSLLCIDHAFQQTFLSGRQIIPAADLACDLIVYEALTSIHDRLVFDALSKSGKVVGVPLSQLQWFRTNPFFFKWLVERELRYQGGPFAVLNKRRVYLQVKTNRTAIVCLTPVWDIGYYNEQCFGYNLASDRWRMPDSAQEISEGDFVICEN